MVPREQTNASPALPHEEDNTIQPPSPINDTFGNKAGPPSYADNDYSSIEDEQTGISAAVDNEVEETPTTKHARLYIEGLKKTPRVVVPSRRLQLPSFQDDILNDGTFSFMPAHQKSAATQPLKGRSSFQTLSAAHEQGNEHREGVQFPTSHRTSEARPIVEMNLTSDQFRRESARNNAESTNDLTLTPHHDSSGLGTESLQEQQKHGKLILQTQEEVSPVAEDVTTEDYGAKQKHIVLYHEQDGHSPSNEGVQTKSKIGSYAPQQMSTKQCLNAGNVDSVGGMSSPFARGSAKAHHIPHSPTTADLAPIHASRVSKAPRRRPPRHVQNSQVHRHSYARTMQRPSEEDLLFLLMSRAREHDESRTRSEHLELENKTLRQEKLQSDADLRQAMDARDGCAREYDLLTQNLKKFKEKYYKLKKWALETNKDCEELQEKASSFERAISDLNKDKDQLLAQLQDTRSTSVVASEQMANIRNGVFEVRLMAEERLAAINQMGGLLEGQCENSRTERQRCNKLEQHILHLEQERDKQNIRMHSEQQELTQTLKGLCDGLKVLRDGNMEDSLEKGRMLESLENIRSALDTDVCTKSDMLSLRDTLETARTSLGMVEKSMSEDLQTTITRLRDSLQKDASAHADRLLSEISSDTAQFNGVEAALAGLEQKAGQMIKLLRDAKTTAEKEGPCLQGIADNLQKALDPERKAAQKTIDDLTTNITEWRLKCQAARSELEKYKQEREAEADEHQAESNDLLALLSEALHEQDCLRSELSKVEDFSKGIQQQNEQDYHEAADRDDCMKREFRDLQGQLDLEIRQQAQAREAIKSLSTAQSQLLRELEISQGETVVAIREQYTLHDEVVDVERRLDWTNDKLEQTLTHLQEVENELGVFRQREPGAEQLKKDFLSQQQEIRDKCQEMQILQNEIEKQQARCAQLEEQAREKDRLVEEKSYLEERLKQAQKEASVIIDLQEELEQKKTKVGDLELALAASQREAQEKDKLAEENTAINNRLQELEKKNAVIPGLQKRLQHNYTKVAELESALEASLRQAQELERLAEGRATVDKQLQQLQKENSELAEVRVDLQQTHSKVAELEDALSAAQDQAAKVDELQKTNTSLKQNVITLDLVLDEMNKKCAQIGPLEDIIKAKDGELAELQRKLVSLGARTDELEKLKNERERMEGECITMQQQILSLEGALSNAKLDEGAKRAQPQRKGADRSARSGIFPDSQLGHSHSDPRHNGVLPSDIDPLDLSSGAIIVAETQLEVPESVPVGQRSLIPPADAQREESNMGLSHVLSEDEEPALEDEIERRIASTQPYPPVQGYLLPTERVRRAANSQGSIGRPFSSSYSSQGDQMLLDQVSQEDASSADHVATGVAPNVVMTFGHIVSGQGASPRRLRSGSQGKDQRFTATPEPGTENRRNRASTPAVRREQHQPNSAVKRRIEPEAEKNAPQENTKRLKRRPPNHEVTIPQHRTSTQPAQPTSPRGSGRWRKSSSVVGTNAPAPGKSQRSSRPTRKGSRQDRYSSRFAPEA